MLLIAEAFRWRSLYTTAPRGLRESFQSRKCPEDLKWRQTMKTEERVN